MGIKSKQIVSLDANKVTTNDDRMFISKADLQKITDLNANVNIVDMKSDLPIMGKKDTLYIVRKDIDNKNKSTMYIYFDNKYVMLSNGSADNGTASNPPYLKNVSVSDWIKDGKEYKLKVERTEHQQEDSRVLFGVVIEDGEWVQIPYKIENGGITFISSMAINCEILITDLFKGSGGTGNGEDSRVGNLADLDTSDRSSIVSAINECFQSASNGKKDIATAISGKGVNASSDDSFKELANKINQISTNDIVNMPDGRLVTAEYLDDFKTNDVGFMHYDLGREYKFTVDQLVHANPIQCVSYDKRYLALGCSSSPYLYVYRKTTNGYVPIKIDKPITNMIYSLCFSMDNKRLFVGANKSPYIEAYNVSDDIVIKQEITGTFPSSRVMAMMCDGDYLITSIYDGSYLEMYKIDGNIIEKKYSIQEGILSYRSDFIDVKDGYIAVKDNTSPKYRMFKRVGESIENVTLPENPLTGNIINARWSEDGRYVIYLISGSSEAIIFKKNEDGTFEDASDFIKLEMATNDLVFSEDGKKVVTCGDSGLAVYEKNEGMTKLISKINVSGDGFVGNAKSIIFRDSNAEEVLVTTYNAPYTMIYKLDGVKEKIRLKGNFALSGNGKSVAIHPSGGYVVYGHSGGNFMGARKRNKSGNYPDLIPIDVLPTGQVNALEWSSDGEYLIAGHSTTPYISVYKFENETLTKLPNPDMLPKNTVYDVAYHPSENLFMTVHNSAPNHTYYKIENDVITKLETPTTLTAVGRSCGWNNTGEYLALSQEDRTFIMKKDGDKLLLMSTLDVKAGIPYSTNWHPYKNYIALTTYDSPRIVLVKMNSESSFEIIKNTTDIMGGYGYSGCWSPDGKYFANGGSTTPYVRIYKFTDERIFESISDGVLSCPSEVYGVDWNKNGDVFFAHTASPYLTHYTFEDLKIQEMNLFDGDNVKVNAYHSEWSPNGEMYAISYQKLPYFSVYKKDGERMKRLKLPNDFPTGQSNYISWSEDNKKLAIAHNLAPYLTIYEINENDELIKIDLKTSPTNNAKGISWSKNGKYLSVAHSSSPYVTNYKVDGNNIVKMPNIPVKGHAQAVEWSPDNKFLAVGTTVSPRLQIFSVDDNGEVKEDTTIDYMMPNNVNNLSWSPNSAFLSVAMSTTSPYIVTYKREYKNFKKINNPDVPPPSSAYECRWSSDGKYLAVAHAGSPFVTIYQKNGIELVKIDNPQIVPTGNCNGVDWSDDGKYLSITSTVAPYLHTYKMNINEERAECVISRTMRNATDKLGLIIDGGSINEFKDVRIIRDIYE